MWRVLCDRDGVARRARKKESSTHFSTHAKDDDEMTDEQSAAAAAAAGDGDDEVEEKLPGIFCVLVCEKPGKIEMEASVDIVISF